MALNENDYIELLRHFQNVLREYEPDAFELTGRDLYLGETPRQNLIYYIRRVIGITRERSRSNIPNILRKFNSYIETTNNETIEDIIISLTPQEQELYNLQEVSLSSLEDREVLIRELENILREIENQNEDSEL